MGKRLKEGSYNFLPEEGLSGKGHGPIFFQPGILDVDQNFFFFHKGKIGTRKHDDRSS